VFIRAVLSFAIAAALTAAPSARHVEQNVFAPVNRERVAAHLAPLVWDEAIAQVARNHSRNMQDRAFFSHVDPKTGDAADRLTQAGVHWEACAENIYQEQGHRDPVEGAVAAWLRSPGHRINLLSPEYTHTGIGVALAPGGQYTITQVFVRYAPRRAR
jgi:uncharacterized protein YkwD